MEKKLVNTSSSLYPCFDKVGKIARTSWFQWYCDSLTRSSEKSETRRKHGVILCCRSLFESILGSRSSSLADTMRVQQCYLDPEERRRPPPPSRDVIKMEGYLKGLRGGPFVRAASFTTRWKYSPGMKIHPLSAPYRASTKRPIKLWIIYGRRIHRYFYKRVPPNPTSHNE